jgi:hypothetical protein
MPRSSVSVSIVVLCASAVIVCVHHVMFGNCNSHDILQLKLCLIRTRVMRLEEGAGFVQDLEEAKRSGRLIGTRILYAEETDDHGELVSKQVQGSMWVSKHQSEMLRRCVCVVVCAQVSWRCRCLCYRDC